MKNQILTLKTIESDSITDSLGMSEDRVVVIFETIESIGEGSDEAQSFTEVAAKVVEKLTPTAEELFFIGMQFGVIMTGSKQQRNPM